MCKYICGNNTLVREHLYLFAGETKSSSVDKHSYSLSMRSTALFENPEF